MASERRRLQPRTALVFAACVVVAIIVDRARGFEILPLHWLFAGAAIGIVCHELGHLMCAAIGSIPIRLIVVGAGPLLWRSRFEETWLELRVLPLSGFVVPYPAVN